MIQYSDTDLRAIYRQGKDVISKCMVHLPLFGLPTLRAPQGTAQESGKLFINFGIIGLERYSSSGTTRVCPSTTTKPNEIFGYSKLNKKVSGGFYTLDGAEMFCRIRSYCSTVAKHGLSRLEQLVVALKGKFFLPLMI